MSESIQKNPGTFKEGHDLSEKWTEATVTPILESMLAMLKRNKHGQEPEFWLTANSIKLLIEIRLYHGIPKETWRDWRKKFKSNEAISLLIRQIEEICEARLVLSGTRMDEFVLKNKYKYADRVATDITSKGKKITNDPLSAGNTVLKFSVVEKKKGG